METVELWFVVREAPTGLILFDVCLKESEAEEKARGARRAFRDAITVVPGEGGYKWHDPKMHAGTFCPTCDA